MSATRCLLLLVAVCATTIACSELRPAAERDAERYVELYEGWAGVSAAHPDDCEALGAALDAWAQDHAVELRAVEARLRELDAESYAAFRETYDPRMDAVQDDLEPLFRCLDDPRVAAAVDKL